MKFYVVTKGSYSYYHIITVTTDPEKAKKIAKKFTDKWEDAKVEEYEDSDKYLKTLWYVRFNYKAEIEKVQAETDAFYYDSEQINQIHVGRGEFAPMWVYVIADDEEGAIKIAAEKRAEFLAKKNGLI